MSLCRLALGIVCLPALFAAAPDGEALYKQRCAMCHDNATDRIPPRGVLATYRPETVIRSLTTGTMREHGKGMSDEEKQVVARFITGKDLGTAPVAMEPVNLCSTPPPAISLNDSNNWNGWGRDLENTRFHPKPGLRPEDVPKLKVKWAFGFPNARFTYGQPTIIGDRLYVTSAAGTVYALNARTGCLYWTFEAGNEARTAISVGPMPGGSGARYAAYFGDDKANVYAINADTGSSIWKTKVDDHPVGRVTGAPILYKDKLYVPVSSVEEAIGQNVKYECCKFRGALVALDARTGKQLWKTHMITDPPKPFKKNSAGTQMYGPAGAAVWSAPTVDVKRGLIYVGTGNSYTDVETSTANAIVAVDMETGSMKWANQVTPRDNFIMGCMKPGVGNCPEEAGPDVDFGSSPILRSIGRGKQILLAGQKSGEVYGLDPDNRGKILWQQKIGEGSALGRSGVGLRRGQRARLRSHRRRGDQAARQSQARHRRAEDRNGRARVVHARAESSLQLGREPLPARAFAGRDGDSRRSVFRLDGRSSARVLHQRRLRRMGLRHRHLVRDGERSRGARRIAGCRGSHGFERNGVREFGLRQIVGRGGNVLLAFSVDGE
jgi:polyvinyl alcohol dehydrogenase (cytochrome)